MPEVLLLTPQRFSDDRGFFSETFSQNWFVNAGLDLHFCQDNHARSTQVGVIRGLHFQFGTARQAKLIRVSAGAILDVAVDIRTGSPTFGQHVAVELSADNWQQLLVPHGFAHGYCTLHPNTEVIYKVDQFYDPTQEAGIHWNDPALGIQWPITASAAILSDKDRMAPSLTDSPVHFTYQQGAKPFNLTDLPTHGLQTSGEKK